jgi:hypothetical protein
MANPFDALNQGLERLSTSPLGMAGLGLLMQPSQSLTPINPMEYAVQGMQMGIQNKRIQQEAMQRQQLVQQEEQRKRMQYLMDIQRYQQEQIKSRQAEQERLRQEEAMNAAIGNLTPEQQAMARAIGPSYLRDMARNSMKPPQQTNLERNLIAAGLQPGTPAFQDAMMKGIMRPSVQIGTPEKPFSPSDLSRIEGPGGETPPIGMTPEQARQAGYRVRQNPPTDTQSVSAGFYSRMAEANAQMDQNLEGILASGIEKARADVPLIGNYTASDAYQVANNLMLDFVTANLRKESGAALGKEETEREFKKYFPQPGDGPKNIERKRQARQLAIESMRLNAGRAAQGRQPTIKQSAPVRNETDFQERLRKYVPGVR